MTTEKLNRIAEIATEMADGIVINSLEYRKLLIEWKAEIDNKFDLRKLEAGDIVRSKYSGNSYVVIENMSGRPVAIRSVTLLDPDEWEKINK